MQQILLLISKNKITYFLKNDCILLLFFKEVVRIFLTEDVDLFCHCFIYLFFKKPGVTLCSRKLFPPGGCLEWHYGSYSAIPGSLREQASGSQRDAVGVPCTFPTMSVVSCLCSHTINCFPQGRTQALVGQTICRNLTGHKLLDLLTPWLCMIQWEGVSSFARRTLSQTHTLCFPDVSFVTSVSSGNVTMAL